MVSSDEFTDYIVEILEPLGPLEVRRMFGGRLFKVEGKQLGVIIEDRLYFKVINEALQEKYRTLGSRQFQYKRKDRPEPVVIKNWWVVPDSAMDNEGELRELAEEILQQEGL